MRPQKTNSLLPVAVLGQIRDFCRCAQPRSGQREGEGLDVVIGLLLNNQNRWLLDVGVLVLVNMQRLMREMVVGCQVWQVLASTRSSTLASDARINIHAIYSFHVLELQPNHH